MLVKRKSKKNVFNILDALLSEQTHSTSTENKTTFRTKFLIAKSKLHLESGLQRTHGIQKRPLPKSSLHQVTQRALKI